MKTELPIALALTGLLGGCAGWDGFWDDLRGTPQYYSHRSIPLEELPAFPRHCLVGDVEVLEHAQCYPENASCYQLDTGNWCTSARAAMPTSTSGGK